MAAYRFVLLWHGESAWNLENHFSGCYDADLSPAGSQEAQRGGEALRGMSEEAIMELSLPTGIPILYELDKNMKPIEPTQFLGDEDTVRKALEAVAAQGKAKK